MNVFAKAVIAGVAAAVIGTVVIRGMDKLYSKLKDKQAAEAGNPEEGEELPPAPAAAE